MKVCIRKIVKSRYRENPFHNFHHAVCVTQMMYSLTHLCRLQEVVTPDDVMMMMVAALCHDLEHPGLGNTFQVNAQTDLAVRYENKSPLENHHCAVTMEILSQSQSNIFCNLNPEKVTSIREMIILMFFPQGIVELILATDLTQHGRLLQSLQEIQSFSFSNTNHVTLLKKCLLKFCDISNETRPSEQAEIWADALLEEYFMQSDREKEAGLPVTPYMDRDTTTKAESQKSFIQLMLLPLCQALCKIFPQMESWTLQPLRDAILRYQRQGDQVTSDERMRSL
ncbi:high affinity cGMP-specific 3',5'-cyclic phosphodiesterase 9A-like [Mantella aurantiaca]